MRESKQEASTKSESRSTQTTLGRATLDLQLIPSPQFNPREGSISRIDKFPPASAHANMVRRSPSTQNHQALLQWQRQYGNRYVQQVISLSQTRETRIQRQTACPPRPAGESALSRAPGGVLPVNVVSSSANQLDIQDFAVDSDVMPDNVTNSLDWQRTMSLIAGNPAMRVAVTGFTDCVGTQQENLNLRRQRVQAVIAAMPQTVQAKILFSFTISTTNFLDTNTTAEGRARNRSVRISFTTVSTQDSCDLLPRANNLDEFIFLVRCLETRLGLTAASDAPRALSVLRQIYYGGATWTRAGNRNPVWNMVIPTRPWASGTDPTPLLGASLMTALQNSQVVEGTDVGHLLTGVDAMMNPQPVAVSAGRFSYVTGLANEEWATWAGDVGSAAAEWAISSFRAGNRADVGTFFQSFASSSDLQGNIDSFAMRAGFNLGSTPPAQLGQTIRLSGTLSEALLKYYRLSGTTLGHARGRRIENFVEAYGGVINNRSLTNRAALVARLRPSVEGFASLFSLQRLAQLNLLNNITPAFTTFLTNGVDEMTNAFVAWLEARL
jgi:outer membrane protein OmpA-like peptidoglycan-associated protein